MSESGRFAAPSENQESLVRGPETGAYGPDLWLLRRLLHRTCQVKGQEVPKAIRRRRFRSAASVGASPIEPAAMALLQSATRYFKALHELPSQSSDLAARQPTLAGGSDDEAADANR